MIKTYEIVKENKLMIDCKNGDLVQFGEHIHIICDDGTNKGKKILWIQKRDYFI